MKSTENKWANHIIQTKANLKANTDVGQAVKSDILCAFRGTDKDLFPNIQKLNAVISQINQLTTKIKRVKIRSLLKVILLRLKKKLYSTYLF